MSEQRLLPPSAQHQTTCNQYTILNLRTELFRPSWTHQRSTEDMRLNLVAMKDTFSKARFNPGPETNTIILCVFQDHRKQVFDCFGHSTAFHSVQDVVGARHLISNKHASVGNMLLR